MSNAQPSKEHLQAIFSVAEQQLNQGQTPTQVRDGLMEKEVAPELATSVVNILLDERSKSLQGDGLKTIAIGALIAGVSIVFACFYWQTLLDGGRFRGVVVAALILGVIQVGRGCLQVFK